MHRDRLLDGLSCPPSKIEIANTAEAHTAAAHNSGDAGGMAVAPPRDAPAEQPHPLEHHAATVRKSMNTTSGPSKALSANERFSPIGKHQPNTITATSAAPPRVSAPTSRNDAIVHAAPAAQRTNGSPPASAEQPPDARHQRDTLEHYWQSGTRYPIHQTHETGRAIFLLAPRTARHFGISEQDQAHSAFQDLLGSMYRQQEEEHAGIVKAVTASTATIRQRRNLRGEVSYSLNSSDDTIVRLFKLHALNPLMIAKLDLAWESFRARSLQRANSAEKMGASGADQDAGAAASTAASLYRQSIRQMAARGSDDPAGAAGRGASRKAQAMGDSKDPLELARGPAPPCKTGAQHPVSAPLKVASSALNPELPGGPAPQPSDAPEASCTSALVENCEPILQPVTGETTAQSPARGRQEHTVRPSQPISGLGSNADTPSGARQRGGEQAVIQPPWTKADRDELLVPRRVGHDGVMRPIEDKIAPVSPQDRANVPQTIPRDMKRTTPDAPAKADPHDEAWKAAQAAQGRGGKG
jgi:hypothetical protein